MPVLPRSDKSSLPGEPTAAIDTYNDTRNIRTNVKRQETGVIDVLMKMNITD